jgi:hypothetical protein
VPIPVEELERQESDESWTPVHPTALSAPEISYYMSVFVDMVTVTIEWFVSLRQTNHLFFCLVVSSLFILTAFIGRSVPGVVVVYAILMILALGPGIGLYVLPSGWFSYLKRLFNAQDSSSAECDKFDARYSQVGNVAPDNSEDRSSEEREIERSLGLTNERLDSGSDVEPAGSDKERASRSRSSSAGYDTSDPAVIKFVQSYFSSKHNSAESNNDDTDDDAFALDNEFEIVTEAEITSVDANQEISEAENRRRSSFLETNL